MTEILDIMKKYGATGVLACWLWFTNSRVESLEDKLIDCYQGRARLEQSNNSDIYNTGNQLLAILPKELRIKNKSYIIS